MSKIVSFELKPISDNHPLKLVPERFAFEKGLKTILSQDIDLTIDTDLKQYTFSFLTEDSETERLKKTAVELALLRFNAHLYYDITIRYNEQQVMSEVGSLLFDSELFAEQFKLPTEPQQIQVDSELENPGLFHFFSSYSMQELESLRDTFNETNAWRREAIDRWRFLGCDNTKINQYIPLEYSLKQLVRMQQITLDEASKANQVYSQLQITPLFSQPDYTSLQHNYNVLSQTFSNPTLPESAAPLIGQPIAILALQKGLITLDQLIKNVNWPLWPLVLTPSGFKQMNNDPNWLTAQFQQPLPEKQNHWTLEDYNSALLDYFDVKINNMTNK